MKARSFRALLLISSLMISTGTTALPVVAADITPDITPDTSDSGLVLMRKRRYTSDIEDEEAEDNEK